MKPILFRVFGFPVHSYGVLLVIAFFIALYMVRRRAPKFGVNGDKLGDALIIALFLGVLGARIVFILQELPYYLSHTSELFSLQFAGLTSFGGLLFGFVWMLIWAKRSKIPAFRMLDVLGPAFLVATAVGRVGCILNGCCYGGVCDPTFPLKILGEDHRYHYPAQLIDSFFNLLGVPILLLLEKKKLLSGQAGGIALMFNGIARFIYEFSRGGTASQVAAGTATSEYMIGHITEAQIASLVVIAVGGAIYFIAMRKPVEVSSLPKEAATA